MKIRYKLIDELRKQYSQEKHTADKTFCCDSCGTLILEKDQYMYDVLATIRPNSTADWWIEEEQEWSNRVYPHLTFNKLCVDCGET